MTNYIRGRPEKKMQEIVRFNNFAVHDYQKLNFDMLESILDERLGNFNRH